MENPNAYDDEAFLTASSKLQDAVSDLWEAGASEDDILEDCRNAIREAQ